MWKTKTPPSLPLSWEELIGKNLIIDKNIMKKNIHIANDYNDFSLWNWNYIRKYNSLDLQRELDAETQIISVQKSTIEILDWILENIWIKERELIPMKDSLWRAWFSKIISKDFWNVWLLATKWADSTMSFSQISDYCLMWTDIWNKVKSKWLDLSELSTISWESLWKYKTEMLLLLWLESLGRVIKNWWDIWNFELDMITTKFTPTLTKMAIDKLPNWYRKPVINEVDSNSELDIQIMEYLNSDFLVWGVEIVQSGSSLIATNNAIVKDSKIIMPSLRNLATWEFYWEVLGELNPESQIAFISNAIQSPINVSLYRNWKNDKPKEFINAIVSEMKKI